MKVAMPSAEQVEALPRHLEHVVPPSWEDLNGHVNFRHYFDLCDLAGDSMLAEFGVGPTYMLEERRGFFELEHHLWYLDELHVGDRVSVHTRYHDRSTKRIHGTLFIVNQSRRELACVLEFVSTGVDLDARRTAALPPDVAARLDGLIASHRALGWPAPICGAIGA